MTQPNYAVWEKMKEEELNTKFDLQKKFCDSKALVCFIYNPQHQCDKCEKELLFYYSERECSVKHITSCALCQRSLCE